MTLDFRNLNTVWASVLVETLVRLGLKTAVICPGSRSTPLAVAFAQHSGIEAIPVLDERSAAFFALGVAKRSRLPVVLVCTSGTAGANFYPAVIEARESRVPLLVLTADRPPELRECNAGQAIDQQKLFGSYPNFYAELALPDGSLLAYLRQTMGQAWARSQAPIAGPVHLNLPFRDPLAPIPQAAPSLPAGFFDSIHPEIAPSVSAQLELSVQRGVIMAGVADPPDPERYCCAIAHLSKILAMPVLAEGLSPLRNYASLNPYLVSTYDAILRNPQSAAQLAPEVVIRVGEMPTSKVLRQWLEQTQPLQYLVDAGDRNLDPLHGRTVRVRSTVESLLVQPLGKLSSLYRDRWMEAEFSVRELIDRTLENESALFEGKAAWLLSQVLPPRTPLVIANSMPVRDVESFWVPNDRAIRPLFNRGANGIDGTLSTALGVAHGDQSTVLLSGDLALLHDTNGFLLRQRLAGHLTIVLINNNGGGIFEMLPIAQFEPFEEFFATPQNIDFAQLCRTYEVDYEAIDRWETLVERLKDLPTQGIRLLELKTNRHHDAQWRKNRLRTFAQQNE
jgi:2-succinyl-5-enolpyruvyl-6-hydroxy-3-cyclohexene-1-carboxylate synthase